MFKTIATIVVLFSSVTISFSQGNTYFGIEAAVTHDVYDIVDNEGKLLKKGPIITGFFGFNVRKDFGYNAFIETGLLRKYYNEGVGFKVFSGYSTATAISSWLIPIRVGAKINLSKKKLFLIPAVGYNFVLILITDMEMGGLVGSL